MRKTALALLLLLIISLILPTAISVGFSNIKVGDEVEDQGWYIKVIRAYENQSALLEVYLDPNKKILEKVELQENHKYDGIYINLTEAFYDENPDLTLLTLMTDVSWKNECEIDSDCDDYDECTKDNCDGYPLKCDSNTNISWCQNNDGCCPHSCSWRVDTDCALNPCDINSDCRDFNSSTNDTCNTENRTCLFTEIWWCESEDEVCPDNCTYTFKLVSNRDLDCSQDNECTTHSDCNDKNDSTKDSCFAEPSTDPKKCIYENYTLIYLEPEEEEPEELIKNKTFEYNQPPKTTEEYVNKFFLAEENRKRTLFILSAVIGFALVIYYIILMHKFRQKQT